MTTPRNGKRRAILDLSPLELDCLNALWPLGEATVRDIRDALAASKPRAYTTIMTIMDRLAHKGIVERRKTGRAYLYRPLLTAEEARADAVGQVVEHFFAGSTEALVSHVGSASTPQPARPDRFAPVPAEPARPSASPTRREERAASVSEKSLSPRRPVAPAAEELEEQGPSRRPEPPLDTTLL